MARSTGAWAIGYLQTCKYRRGQEAVNPEGRGLTVAPFPAGFEYAFSDANYARNRIRHPVALMTTDVLKDQLQPYAAHRRLERRLGIREPKDVGQALAIPEETKALLEARPVLFEALCPPSDEGAAEVGPVDYANEDDDPLGRQCDAGARLS